MQDTANDEIDFIELIETLWDAKWLIAAITACFSVLSVAFAFLLPAGFEGKLRISALTKQQMAAYQTLNNTPGISTPIYAGGVLGGQTGVMLSEDMFAALTRKISEGRIFGVAHQNLDPSIKTFDGSTEELAQALAKIGQAYTFTLEDKSENTGTLSFKTGNRELALAIVEMALSSATGEIRTDNLAAIADLSRSIETSLNFELDEVTAQIDNALANSEIETIARRALLKEQAAIARQLGNANGAAIASSTSGINVAVEQEQPLYLRGYKALEKEIALIDARGKGADTYPYIEDYVSLAATKRALESDKRLQRIETGLAQTPLSDAERFEVANYDTGTVVFEATSSKRLIVSMATLMGGLLAVIFVLIRSAMIARQEASEA
ncbi:MAG: Wzz/FepE/Etk N-terminal domain-containing protein [Parvibaculales bacterium]